MSVQVIPREAPHLGGYVPGGDAATMYPMLWHWLVAERGVCSVLDVGCGDGAALAAFQKLGCCTLGIDGVPQESASIATHDYTAGPFDLSVCPACGHAHSPASCGGDPSGVCGTDGCGCGVGRLSRYDLVWSCEFVEHVEARYLPNFLATFRLGDLVLLTHAEPGQEGHHHVNCQPAGYWRGAMAAIGYREDSGLTRVTRALAGANPSAWNHYARSGLAFVRDAG